MLLSPPVLSCVVVAIPTIPSLLVVIAVIANVSVNVNGTTTA